MSQQGNAAVPAFSHSNADLVRMLSELERPGVPSFFTLSGQLPAQGRTDTPIAASDRMAVVLKAYAATGENELHAHPNEDHVFFVLQGQAAFHGPHGEIRTIGTHEGVMLPHGTFYWFKATSEEPLVMIRVGCAVGDAPRQGRIGIDGLPMDGHSAANKEVPVVLSGRCF